MKSNPYSTATLADKWQAMLAVVNQDSDAAAELSSQFRKLYFSRLFTENILAFLFQYAGLVLTTTSSQPAVLWFATGASSAFIFMRGYSVLPGIWLGGLLAYYLADASAVLAAACSSVFTMQTCLLLWVTQRYVAPTLQFYQMRQWLIFFFAASVLTAVSAGLLLFFCCTSILQHAALWQLWLQWWLANLNGIVIFSIAVITWDSYFPQVADLKPDIFMQCCYGLLLVFVVLLMFQQSPILITSMFISILLLLWQIAYQYNWCGAVAACFLFGLLLSIGALLNAPLFGACTMFTVQLVLTAASFSGLLLSGHAKSSVTL